MGASIVEGRPVVNALGQDFGYMEKIMLDVRRGRIAYAVLSVAAGFGVPHKLMAVPWCALILDAKRKRFVLDLSGGLDGNEDRWPEADWHNEAGPYHGA